MKKKKRKNLKKFIKALEAADATARALETEKMTMRGCNNARKAKMGKKKRKWVHVGGDLQASARGRYVDFRMSGTTETIMFASRGCLLKAATLIPDSLLA